MHEEGFKFYISKNGVWLIKSVPIQYLEHINKAQVPFDKQFAEDIRHGLEQYEKEP